MTHDLNTMTAFATTRQGEATLRRARERGRSAKLMTHAIKLDPLQLAAYSNGIFERSRSMQRMETHEGETLPLDHWLEIDFLAEQVEDQFELMHRRIEKKHKP